MGLTQAIAARMSTERLDAHGVAVLTRSSIAVGEAQKALPKEQPPRKLSGHRTTEIQKTLERGA